MKADRMFTDNPTYFSVAGTGATPAPSTSHPRSLTSFFRRKGEQKMGSTSSASVVSASTNSTLANLESDALTDDAVSLGLQGPTISVNGHSTQRRSFRNLFRSVSANADPEKTQQFLNGDPRPSDVAPPSPYLPHRSHSHSENDRRRPARKKILKSASELLSNDMVYCGLPGEETPAVIPNGEHDEEVFLGVDDARYYNVSATLPTPGSAAAGRRRHSIGTFLNRTNNSNVNQANRKINEPLRLPDTMAPPIPILQEQTPEPETTKRSAKNSRRRRHRSASSKGTRTAVPPRAIPIVTDAAPDDVVLVSSCESEDAVIWVNYLVSCFAHISKEQGRPPFKVHHATFEDTRTTEAEERIGAARLRIIVVCPGLLELVTSKPMQAASLGRQLASNNVLAMMLGVEEEHVTDIHRVALVSYTQWKKFFVKDKDEKFVGDLIGTAITVLRASTPQASKVEQTSFSVLPKKVKMGQSRVIALLNDPLQPTDVVTVVVDRCGEAIDVTHVKKRNPYTLQFSIPVRCLEVSMLVGVRISKNGEALGVRQVKCESRLRELDEILRANDNPLEFMCQTLGFNSGDREQLDNWMVHAFQRNLPPHFNLLSTPAGMVPAHKNYTSPEESPTLLHFAARFGLEKLAWQLLECPGGDLACDLKNVSELTPADLAEQAGHLKLAHTLSGYMQMNEFTNMYTYLKVMSESTSTPTPGNRTPIPDNQEEYCQPRPMNDLYRVPPSARPLASVHPQPVLPTNTNVLTRPNMGDYAIAPTPTPVQMVPSSTTTQANGLDLPLQGYMEMHAAALKTPVTPTLPRAATTPGGSARSEPSVEQNQNREESTPTPSVSGKQSTAKTRKHAGPQEELLEIIHDFKNNVFTISEVENLVETWRNRNDVQQNFKEKHRQLMAMRDEYERIQKMMKENMKRPTPFDRVRKFFSKGKRETSKETPTTDETAVPNKNDASASHRPVSSLSLHSVSSSSSSGRMSIVSECSGASLGDSGTHSDPDERKRASTDMEDGLYYEVPPAPRPYPTRYSPVRYVASSTNNLYHKPPQPVPKPVDDTYYITCPPSGLPIHSFKADGTLREPETPNSPSEEAEYLELLTSDSQSVGSGNSNGNGVHDNAGIQAPPGMCIPTEYMNFAPCGQSSMQQKKFIRELAERCNPHQTIGGTSEDVLQTRGTEEYVESDVMTEALSGEPEVQDTSDLPDYVNVGVASGTTTPTTPHLQRLPAPPVPPRTKTVR